MMAAFTEVHALQVSTLISVLAFSAWQLLPQDATSEEALQKNLTHNETKIAMASPQAGACLNVRSTQISGPVRRAMCQAVPATSLVTHAAHTCLPLSSAKCQALGN